MSSDSLPSVFQGRTFELHRNKDGTDVPWAKGTEGRQVFPQGSNEGKCSGRYLDDLSALQAGLYYILNSLEFTTVNREALILQNRVKSNTFELERTFFDFPDSDDGNIPQASATIMADAVQNFSLDGALSETQIFEDTVDVYEPCTVLKYMYTLETVLSVICIVSNKDLRSGLRKGITEAFHEPDSETYGRRVQIPVYYDRIAQFFLQDVEYLDDKDNAHSGRYPMVIRFNSDIHVVKLIETPPEMRIRSAVGVTTEELS